MVAVHAPVDKTRTYTPTKERAVFTAPRGLARRVYRRVRVNDLSTLWPENQFRAQVLKFAQQFVRDMEHQGFLLQSAEADIVVSGPFEPRDWQKAASGVYRGTRHVREPGPNGRQYVEQNVLAPMVRIQPRLADKEDFLLEAEFVSTRTVLVEHAVSEASDG